MSITSYIKTDLIKKIQAGGLRNYKLTLEDISRQYQVSATPVRSAVRQLIDEGYLSKGDNRRLTVQFHPYKSSQSTARSLEEPKDWFQIVGNDLVRLSLNGEPLLLREEATAEKYGISRSAIRQIFHQLASSGVLIHLPRRGWQLRPFQQEDLDAYIDMRELLELKALDVAWSRLVDEELQAILDRNVLPATAADQVLNDNSLHTYLIEKSKNPYIADFFERHGKYYAALFDWEALDRDAQIQAVQHHRDILEALLAREREAAQRALSNHIRNNHPILRSKLADQHHAVEMSDSGHLD
jgi:DNA-binding GntR family transcriptional regulator